LDGKQHDPDGWIYKTVEEITCETGLSYREQATARKHLINLGVLEEHHNRLEHKMFFRINHERLDTVWEAWLEKEESRICNSRTAESAFREVRNAQFGECGKRNSGTAESAVRIDKGTETTSEITSETTTENISASPLVLAHEEEAAKSHQPVKKERIPVQGPWPSVAALEELYNEKTPDECSAVHYPEHPLSSERIKKAKRFLTEFPEQVYWEEVFAGIHRSPFLRGLRSNIGHGHFRADFDWLLSKGKDGSENFVKVHDGRYDN
jgi:hypothetical protein